MEINSVRKPIESDENRLWKLHTSSKETFDKNFEIFTKKAYSFQTLLDSSIKDKNLTYDLVAYAIDIDVRTLRGYKAGRTAPSIQTLVSICIVLDLDAQQAAPLFLSLGFCLSGNRPDLYAYTRLLNENNSVYSRLVQTQNDKNDKVTVQNMLRAKIKKCNILLTEWGIDEQFHLKPRKSKV